MTEEKVVINGHKVTLIHTASGYSAHGGAGYTQSFPTREAAIRDYKRVINSANDRDRYESRQVQARQKAHEAKTTECNVCRVRVSNLAAHQKSKRHQNALAYHNSRYASRY